jgi:PKD repeat protein
MSVNATDPDGDYPLNITWVFNDGPTFYGPNVSRAFPFTGTFSVAVTVKDALGLAAGPDTLTFNVRVAPPVPDFTWSPPIPETNQTVQFNDTTQAGSTPITKWVWDFGDGSSTTVTTPGQQNVTHVYTRPPQVGNNGFTVTLTVSSLGNPDVSVQHNVPVNSPPVANFFYTPTSPNVGDTVTFNDTSSDPDGEPITMRHWDFGDNTSADTTDPTITHRYTGPGAMGTHHVNLTATDARGASASIVKSIYVSDLAPTADFTINPLTPPHANSPIQFLDRSTSPNGNDTISFWDWNFGDNTTLVGTDPAVDQNPFHTYPASGIYSVTLIVGDGNLNSTPTTHTIRVTADHPMQFEINATLPSGVCVNVNDPNIDYEPRLNTNSPVVGLGVKANVSLGKAQFAASACGGNFTLQAGAWAGGDGATVELDVYPPGYPAISLALNYVMSDSMGGSPVVASFTVPLPLVPTIEALPNNDSGLIVPHGPGYDNGTVYHDLITPFHGDGTVHYLDGSPAPGATVTVQLRYVPLYLPGSHTTLRDQLNLPNTPILGWCDADTETTAANGTYTWQVTQSNCLLQPTLSLPGHWEARAVVSAPLEATEISKPCEIFEDPTGLLATIYLP